MFLGSWQIPSGSGGLNLATRGSPIGLEDVLIGATALQHDAVVATRNRRHFERIAGLRVESWFDP
jgi:tRNA(fMet)-specific endonuclease VapC